MAHQNTISTQTGNSSSRHIAAVMDRSISHLVTPDQLCLASCIAILLHNLVSYHPTSRVFGQLSLPRSC